MNETLPQDAISISEAAEIMGVSQDTLRRWDESRKFPAFKSKGGHRFYSRKQAASYANDLYELAYEWASAKTKIPTIPQIYYCEEQPLFQSRLTKMQNFMMNADNPETRDIFSLVVAVAGEIGNNSFDHNSGYWPDERGIFFGYNLPKKQIVLADRGQGILKTLQRVRPNLTDHQDALEVAFNEVVSGRAPAKRGNGLKFVKSVVTDSLLGLTFQTGDAKAELKRGDRGLNQSLAPDSIRGCIALITY